jgi:SAM-dependent methyltransferase
MRVAVDRRGWARSSVVSFELEQLEPRPTLPPETLEWIRRTRRFPGPTQPDYMSLRRLVQHLGAALGRLGALEGPLDVLDVFCGTRPYEDLLPDSSRVTGFDVDDHYGHADITSREFLPFPDASFDVVVSTEGFYFLPDAAAAAAEMRRVLRPEGRVVITVPMVWEYNREHYERRFTGPDLASVFSGGWEDVEVEEVGGYAVAWATLGGRIVRAAEELITHRGGVWRRAGKLFEPLYLALNAVALLIDRFERRMWRPLPFVFPDHVLLSARRVDD